MVSLEEVERQLGRIDVSFRFWGRAEMLELQNILIPGEQIQVCINGRYEGGFAMLCATDQRLLLIDKKPLYLTLEDVRYDMVAEVDFSHRFIDATIHVCTPSKTLRFTTWRRTELRKMTGYLQHRVIEIRQNYAFHTQAQQQFVTQQPQYQAPTVAPTNPVAAPLPVATAGTGQLPTPSFLNLYAKNPVIMRRRVSRFQRPQQ